MDDKPNDCRDAAFHARTAMIGEVIHRFAVPVERGRLKLFAKAIGETDPIYSDEAAAKSAGYPDVVAPPTFVYCLSEDVPNPNAVFDRLRLDVSKAFHAEQDVFLDRPLCAGQEVLICTRLKDYFEKRDGRLKFVVTESLLADEQERSIGRLVTTVIVKEPK